MINTDLPQFHDWFIELLTLNQWLVVWIVLSLVTTLILAIWVGEEAGDVGMVVALGVWGAFAWLILWGLIVGVLNVVSWLVYLWNT